MDKIENYTIDEIAQMYGVTNRKASDWIRRGAIPFMRIKGTRIYVRRECLGDLTLKSNKEPIMTYAIMEK